VEAVGLDPGKGGQLWFFQTLRQGNSSIRNFPLLIWGT
jgi:hypothetical protein